jgi:hypothetical protein
MAPNRDARVRNDEARWKQPSVKYSNQFDPHNKVIKKEKKGKKESDCAPRAVR